MRNSIKMNDALFRAVKAAYLLSIPNIEFYLLFLVPMIYWMLAFLLVTGSVSILSVVLSIPMFAAIHFLVPLRFLGQRSGILKLIEELAIDTQAGYWQRIVKCYPKDQLAGRDSTRKMKMYLRATTLIEVKLIPNRIANAGLLFCVGAILFRLFQS